jgi:predicted RNA-binding Zn-ribbon protein involved in translation (DUF1610 family)
MPKKSDDRVQYTVSCRCGAKLSLDAREFGKPRNCKKCGNVVTVMWGKDPATRRNVPMVVTQARMRAGVRADQAPSIAYCGCGYKLPVSQKAQSAPPNCPGCGKLMVVESKKGTPFIFGAALPKKEDRPASSSAIPAVPTMYRPGVTKITPPAPGKPAPAPGVPTKRPLRLGEVACRCGEIIPPRTSKTGKAFTCPSCRRQGRVEETKDEKGQPQLKATFSSEPAGPTSAPPPAPPPQPYRGTVEAPIQPYRGTAVPPAAAVPPAPPPAAKAPAAAEPEGLFEEFDSNVEVEFAPLSVVDGQQVLCDCGSQIIVTPADAGQHAQCPQCGIVMLVEQVQDSAGGPPFMRVRTVGRMDQDTWTLEDFQ